MVLWRLSGKHHASEEARESLKQDALASWASYQNNGRHLTGGEVREWLNSWGTEEEKAVPMCHD